MLKMLDGRGSVSIYLPLLKIATLGRTDTSPNFLTLTFLLFVVERRRTAFLLKGGNLEGFWPATSALIDIRTV